MFWFTTFLWWRHKGAHRMVPVRGCEVKLGDYVVSLVTHVRKPGDIAFVMHWRHLWTWTKLPIHNVYLSGFINWIIKSPFFPPGVKARVSALSRQDLLKGALSQGFCCAKTIIAWYLYFFASFCCHCYKKDYSLSNGKKNPFFFSTGSQTQRICLEGDTYYKGHWQVGILLCSVHSVVKLITAWYLYSTQNSPPKNYIIWNFPLSQICSSRTPGYLEFRLSRSARNVELRYLKLLRSRFWTQLSQIPQVTCIWNCFSIPWPNQARLSQTLTKLMDEYQKASEHGENVSICMKYTVSEHTVWLGPLHQWVENKQV